MADDLDLKNVKTALAKLGEPDDDYHISLSNWSVNLVKYMIALKTNEFEVNRFKKQFADCATNEEKVRLILSNEQMRDKLYELLEDKADGRSAEKDWQKAKQLRIDGKKKADAKEWDDALWYFWRAISLSPLPGSKKTETEESKSQLGLAFFDRAETLLQMKRYADCLEDIENAIHFGLTFQTHPKLLFLKIKCSKCVGEMQTMTPEALQDLIDALEEYEAESNDSKTTEEVVELIEEIKNPYGTRQDTTLKRKTVSGCLYKGSNKRLPCASQSIKLNFSPEKGRLLEAIATIPGDSNLIVEKPYSSVLCLLAYKDYCFHCFKPLNQRGYPCDTCDKVTFCSSECAKTAIHQYHKYECKYMNVLIDAEIFHLALRTLMITGVEKAIEAVQSYEETNDTFSGDYSSVLSLVEHSDELPLLNNMSYTLFASFLALLARDKMKLFPKDEELLVKVGAIILRHIKQAVFNATEIMLNDDSECGPSIDGTKIGIGFYPTTSLINHSCDPNVTPMFDGLKLFMKAKRNLDAGEELTVNYAGVHVNQDSRRKRQNELKKYYFECKCSSCEDTIEKYRDAFLCPKCAGPVVVDEDSNASHCLECNEENVLQVVDILAEFKSLETSLQYTAGYFQSGRIKDPKDAFEKIHEKAAQICHPKNQFLMQLKDILANNYRKKNDFENALKYAEEVVKMERLLFGDSCVYVVYKLVLLTTWRWNTVQSENKDQLAQLKEETRKVIEMANKTFQERKAKGFVLISTNYVNCKKQIEDLSKKIKG